MEAPPYSLDYIVMIFYGNCCYGQNHCPYYVGSTIFIEFLGSQRNDKGELGDDMINDKSKL